MWVKIANFILKFRLPLVFLLIGVTGFMAWNASKAELTYELNQILPKEHKTFKEFEQFSSNFTEDANMLLFGFEEKDVFQAKVFNEWFKLGEEIRAVEGVRGVISVPHTALIEKNTEEKKFEIVEFHEYDRSDLDSMKQVFLSLPFYRGRIYNETTNATLMGVYIDKQVLDSKQRMETVNNIIDKVKPFAKENNLDIKYSGIPYLRSFRVDTVTFELRMFLIAALLISSLILLFLFRSFTGVILPLLVVIIGVIWSVGTIYLLGYKITMLTGLIPTLMVIIGIPNCVYWINKYQMEYVKSGNQNAAIQKATERIGNVIFYANLTTAIGFGVFSFTRSMMLFEFGLVAGLNVLATFFITLILMPSIFSWLKPPKAQQVKHLERNTTKVILSWLEKITYYFRRPIMIGSGVLAIAAIIGMLQLKAQGFIYDDIPEDSKAWEDMKFFEKNFGGVVPLEVIVDTKKKGSATKINTLNKIDRLQKIFDYEDLFTRPLSLAEGVKYANQSYYKGLETKYVLPNQLESSFIFSYMKKMDREGQEGVLDNFTDSLRQKARISLLMKDVGSGRLPDIIDSLTVEAHKIFNPEKTEILFTGSAIMVSEGYNYLIKGLINSVLWAFLLISLIIAYLFRSFRMLLVALIPNILPLLTAAGIMGFSNIYLKPSTVLIFSVALGISVDFTIHILAKVRIELANNNWNIRKTVSEALFESGFSMIYTALILFSGFAIFMGSQFQGTFYLGLLTSITLIISLFTNLVLLPAILLSVNPNALRRVMELEEKEQAF